jgi:hypothetical protein
MTVPLVAFTAGVIVAATLIKARVDSEKFRGPRQDEHDGPHKDELSTKKASDVIASHKLPSLPNGLRLSRDS